MSAVNKTDINYFRKFIFQASHYVFGQGISLIAGFISFPILTRVFSTAEYGVLNLISILFWVTLAFTKAGLQESGVRFYNDFEKPNPWGTKRVYYNTLFFGGLIFMTAGVLVVWGILTFLLKKDVIPELKGLILIVLLTIVMDTLLNRLSNFLRAEQRTGLFNIFGILNRYLGLILGVGFLFVFSINLKNFYLGSLLAEFLLVVALLLLFVHERKIDFSGISLPFLKECIIFGFPLIGFELANYLIKTSDRYLIQIYLNTDAVGIYSAGANLCHYLKDIIMFPILFAITPLYMELWQKEGKEATSAFISKILKYILFVSIPLIIGFSFIGEKVVIILASEKFAEAAKVIPYLITGAVLYSFLPLFSAGLYIQKKTSLLTSLIIVGVALNTVLNILLIPQIQLMGAALATLITYLVILAVMIILSRNYLPISVDWMTLGKTVLGSFSMFLILRSLNLGIDLWGLGGDILIGVLFYSIFLILFDLEIREIFFKLISLPVKNPKI
jgi:O-antigen/teichoic acid export membrane protein